MGSLVFQATLGGQVNLNGPNTASTFDIAVPATTGTMVTTGDSGTVTNTMLAASAYNTPGAIGSGTANTGAFTTLSASSTVSGTGFSTYLASPPAIGGTTAASGRFSSLTNTGLTSGRVVYSTTSGLETDSANLTFDGTTFTVASRGIAKSGMPAGSILQVVQGTYSTQSSMTGTTATATGITATITPTSSTSKIFILVSIPSYNASPAANANFTIYKGGSPLNTIAYFQGGAAALADTYTGVLIDSPATTSATTYSIYATTAAAATVYWAFGNYQCSITLMEIAV